MYLITLLEGHVRIFQPEKSSRVGRTWPEKMELPGEDGGLDIKMSVRLESQLNMDFYWQVTLTFL